MFERGPQGWLQPIPPEAARSWTGDERHRELAAALDRFGLWDHLPEDRRAQAVADTAAGHLPLHADELFGHVEFPADGESISEGGVERFLERLAPAVERFGVTLQVETLESPYRAGPGHDYVIAINGIRCTVWLASDLGDTWTPAVVRPLAVVNRLLEAAGSAVRAHTVWAGTEDGLVLLLDPRAVEALRASGFFPDREVPALAETAAHRERETTGPARSELSEHSEQAGPEGR